MRIERKKSMKKLPVLLFYEENFGEYLFFKALNIYDDYETSEELKEYELLRNVNYTLFGERACYLNVSSSYGETQESIKFKVPLIDISK